jgi:hypothetical protein
MSPLHSLHSYGHAPLGLAGALLVLVLVLVLLGRL